MVTVQSVTNSIICQNVMLVTDMLCWRHEIQFGAINVINEILSIFKQILRGLHRRCNIGHQHHNTPECDLGDWYLMSVPNSRCWWRDFSPTSKSCHQHIWSPTSVTNIDVTLSPIKERSWTADFEDNIGIFANKIHFATPNKTFLGYRYILRISSSSNFQNFQIFAY